MRSLKEKRKHEKRLVILFDMIFHGSKRTQSISPGEAKVSAYYTAMHRLWMSDGQWLVEPKLEDNYMFMVLLR